ncbi:hypothetical protein GINT2_000910 [Glugoides intestinalis]
MESKNIGDLHIKQFDALFTNSILVNAVVNTPPLEIHGLKLSFDAVEIHKPFILEKEKNIVRTDRRLLPKDCREQGLTYGGKIFIRTKLQYNGRIIFNEYRDAGVFPVMLRTSYCHLSEAEDLFELGEDPREPGGYFIVGGFDKLVRFHVALKRNFFFAQKKKSKDNAYTDYSVIIRSVSESEIGQKNEIKYSADGNIHYKIFLNKRIYLIPVVLILRALVNCTDEEIFVTLGSDQRVLTTLAKMKDYDCYSQKECLEYLGIRFNPILKIADSYECGRQLIQRFVMVHLDCFQDKFSMIIEGIKKLLRCYDGQILPDNIDSPANFELFTELQLIPLCFREKLNEIKKTFISKLTYVIRNSISTTDSTTSLNASELVDFADSFSEFQIQKIKKVFNGLDFDIGQKLKRLLSTGNITTVCCSDLLQTGSFSILGERINLWRFSTHFESVSRGAFFATLKLTTVRKLRPESWGFFCPLNTPDGSQCGLLSHLTKACFVSDKAMLLDESVIYEAGVSPAIRGFNGGVPVFYNGKLVGGTTSPEHVARFLREYRGRNSLCFEVCYESGKGIDESIQVFDSFSTLYRKVFNKRINAEEWIGIKEQAFLDIKLAKYSSVDAFNSYDNNSDKDFYEYEEIDNMNILSSIASTIPFSNHNPSPRSIYQCQMAKQAMGIAAFNQKYRTDVKTFFVNYLQSPMVKTSGYDIFKDFPIGFNCIVAVLSYTAYDMEDAVIINKSASERGLFSAFIYKNEKFELEKNSFIDYTPFVGSIIQTGDLLVRYTHPDFGTKLLKYTGTETGYVDTVRVFTNEVPCVTVTLRITRNPNIGDKFCSRHGQKGICSMLWPEVDMPFTEDGLRPDIIINPHAFPSRMTIGMLLESMCGKTALMTGETQNATPFAENSRGICEELGKCGFNRYGNEPMYSGITGTEFKTDIFVGSVYYQRLRHMVNDKYQVRTSGAVVATTHQPVGGRKNKGGIRFGEMEKDALISHGVSYTLKDRLMNCSDRTDFMCCTDCKSILFTEVTSCKCGSEKLKSVTFPYVFKYLCCELYSMNIKVKVDF